MSTLPGLFSFLDFSQFTLLHLPLTHLNIAEAKPELSRPPISTSLFILDHSAQPAFFSLSYTIYIYKRKPSFIFIYGWPILNYSNISVTEIKKNNGINL